MKLYGSLQNRLEENKDFCETITVGTGMTEYFYSDRKAYEVIAVEDQKHVTVRMLDHAHVGNGVMDNNWKLVSNPKNPVYEMAKRGKYWYYVTTITADMLDDASIENMIFLAMNGIDADKLREKKVMKRYHRANVSFGVANYYYDYEF